MTYPVSLCPDLNALFQSVFISLAQMSLIRGTGRVSGVDFISPANELSHENTVKPCTAGKLAQSPYTVPRTWTQIRQE